MSSPNCTGILPNPDISGIGVRIALYLQALFNVFLSVASPEERHTSFWTLTITSLGLLASTLISQSTEGIALYHAIIVMYLTILSVFASTVTARAPGRPTASIFLAESLEKVVAVAFGIYVWISAPTFGNQPECNAQTCWVLFVGKFSATGTARVLNLFFLGVTAGLIFWSFKVQFKLLVWACVALCSPEARMAWKLAIEDPVALPNTQTSGGADKNVKWRNMLPIACFTVGWIAVVTSVELTIRWNDVLPGNSAWSFGQTLALALLFAPVMSLCEYWYKCRDEWPADGASHPRREISVHILGWVLFSTRPDPTQPQPPQADLESHASLEAQKPPTHIPLPSHSIPTDSRLTTPIGRSDVIDTSRRVNSWPRPPPRAKGLLNGHLKAASTSGASVPPSCTPTTGTATPRSFQAVDSHVDVNALNGHGDATMNLWSGSGRWSVPKLYLPMWMSERGSVSAPQLSREREETMGIQSVVDLGEVEDGRARLSEADDLDEKNK